MNPIKYNAHCKDLVILAKWEKVFLATYNFLNLFAKLVFSFHVNIHNILLEKEEGTLTKPLDIWFNSGDSPWSHRWLVL